MSGRPTPEQIADDIWCSGWGDVSGGDSGGELLGKLKEHGYVIVRPDDVPLDRRHEDWSDETAAFARGWNACRAHIFGEES